MVENAINKFQIARPTIVQLLPNLEVRLDPKDLAIVQMVSDY